MSNTTKVPRPPKNLGAEGRKIWRAVLAELDLDAHEMSLLRSICRTADHLERISDALEGVPLVIANRFGEPVSHPLQNEHRQQALTLARLIASLRLPAGLGESLTDDLEKRRPPNRSASRGARGTYISAVK